MMTSIALTRETERGTMENLLAMPASPAEIMLGKVLPYLVVGAVQVAVVLTRGEAAVLRCRSSARCRCCSSAILVFVLALVLLGYTISTVARTQMQAMQLTFFFFLPSILLSGFMFPYRGMPGWAQALGEILPLTHFLRIIRARDAEGRRSFRRSPGEVGALTIFVVVFAGAGAAAVPADAGLTVWRAGSAGRVGALAVLIGARVPGKYADDEEGGDGDDRNEQGDGPYSGLAHVMQALDAERDIRPDGDRDGQPEGGGPELAGGAVRLHQHEPVDQEQLEDGQEKNPQEEGRAVDPAGEAEEEPNEL